MSQLPTFYQEFIHKSRYARWLEEEGRRENWDETVNRYLDFFENHVEGEQAKKKVKAVRKKLFDGIYGLNVMPSMRALMTAGPALERDNVAGYNCSYIPIDSIRAFDELMYVLMCGTGVGFSVERQYVSKMPIVAEEFHDTTTTITVHDSKIGWAKSFRELLSLLWVGQVPRWDVSAVRPAGAKLKTFGGRASGPDPLVELFEFTIVMMKKAAGRKLTSIECHDLVCKIAKVVVVGGVRRSALLSLSNVSDDRMRAAKTGQWWVENPQREISNNSACYTEKPEFSVFLREWNSLYESKSGERGIFSRLACKKQTERTERRESEHEFGTNPCSEIILRPYQFCNLSEVVVRPGDTLDDLKKKAELAAILGTLQSTLTKFRYLRKIWQRNTTEERLLGVSLTGIMDHKTFHFEESWQEELKEVVIKTNKKWAAIFGIEPSTATTCVKPSGTVSQLVDSASGIHARYSPFYVRRVRCDKRDPLAQFMINEGFTCEDDVSKPEVVVFSFPIKSPTTSIHRDELTAIQQIEVLETFQDNWCEHKPSCTIYYKDEEFLALGDWVYNNFDKVSGVAFLPHTDHVYKQAPYEEIDEETYNRLVQELPKAVNWDEMASYEQEDNTTGSQEFACNGNACELVDIGLVG